MTTTRQLLAPVELDFAGEPLQPQPNPAIAYRQALKPPMRKNDVGMEAPSPAGGSLPVNDKAMRVSFGIDADFLK